MSMLNGANSHAATNVQNVPNLYWGATSPQQLRRSEGYQALPDPGSIIVSDTCHYRFLRQTSGLRHATHHGIQTTAHLRDALGFSEPEAAKFLGASAQVGTGWAPAGCCAILSSESSDVAVLPSNSARRQATARCCTPTSACCSRTGCCSRAERQTPQQPPP
jgi:hypothetical protein